MPTFDARGRCVASDGPLTVLPGFVNAHSHSFQRALRGRVERRSAEHPHDDFWAWRDAMYSDAARVTVDDIEVLATWCFADMVRTGFTAVGEFHYLHHDVGGRPFVGAQHPHCSVALARAAAAVGIRLTVLETAYARGGFNRPLADAQRRFAFEDVEAFLEHVERSRVALRAHGASVGVAIHSVRACPRHWVESVAAHAALNSLNLHVHACEQRREIEECIAEHGMGPIALLHATGALGPRTTVVHGTHVTEEDIRLLASTETTVCITPSTERNLGDGLCPIADLVAAGVRICIGTDSHARIDVADELRSLEDHERLRLERRNVLIRPGSRLCEALLPAGTDHGASALGLDARDDRVALSTPVEGKAGDPAAGLDAWLVGGSGRDVVEVDVAGRAVVREGAVVTVDMPEVERRALEVLRRLAT